VNRIKSLAAVSLLAAIAAGACSSTTPDEFRVVRKAPLTVPPDYNLRPPAPGEARPQELLPDAQARVAVFGSDIGQGATQGEKLFIAAAGGDAVDRSIRNQLDYDSAQILRKNRSLSNAIFNFGKAKSEPVIDPAAEEARLKAEQAAVAEVTGGKAVLIRRKDTSKLPGL
jgi:hypothetical protein